MTKTRSHNISAQELLNELQEEVKARDDGELYQFTPDEQKLIKDLIVKKDNTPAPLRVINEILSKEIGANLSYSGATLRRCWFLKELLGSARGNATKAAKASGYSPRSAKQQGYRLVREIKNAHI